MVNYFFDSYATIELLNNNPRYQKYRDYPFVMTFLNKVEVCWWGLTRHGEEFADILLRSFSDVQEVSDTVLKRALILRQEHKKRDLSYTDAIGYAFALENDLLFLTGDKQFKDLPAVEFVK